MAKLRLRRGLRRARVSSRDRPGRLPVQIILCRIVRMRVETRNIRSATQAARSFGSILEEVESGDTIVVVKNNRPVAAVSSISTLERLDEIDEREEDLRLLVVALTRVETSQGPLRDWEDVAAELGIDLADVRDGDDQDVE